MSEINKCKSFFVGIKFKLNAPKSEKKEEITFYDPELKKWDHKPVDVFLKIIENYFDSIKI